MAWRCRLRFLHDLRIGRHAGAEHPFHVADTAKWTRADGLRIGDHLSTITGTTKLQGVIFTTERVPVYNLSIPGSPTYYVGEHGVWVHNCNVTGFSKVWDKKHGPHLARQLAQKARNSGNPQSYFEGSKDAIESFVASHLPLNRGAIDVVAPSMWGRVVHPDGQISFTNIIRIVPSGNGVKTVYPVPY
ncbi:MAG: hypothetical protein JKY43_07890 [Phycisphaerales bacterium]|nr:hypothetical protein [Phycisphaerales bacterium]